MEMIEGLISIIVPVYNASSFLDECVQSILQQTYSSIEVVLVDDGSTDNSFDICQSYAIKDNRIRVFRKENGGVSSARNFGINQSRGRYLGFVDSDDSICSDMYEKLHQILTNSTDVAFVSCNEQHILEECDHKVLNGRDFCGNLLTDKVSPYIWNKLFDKTLIKEKLKFRETLRASEDFSLLLEISTSLTKERIICLSDNLYNYRVVPQGLSSNYKNYYFVMKSLQGALELLKSDGFLYELSAKRFYSYLIPGLHAAYSLKEFRKEYPLFRKYFKTYSSYSNENNWGVRHKCYYYIVKYFPYLLRLNCIARFCTNRGPVPPYC